MSRRRISKEKIDKFLEAKKKGHTDSNAACLSGVHRNTISNYLRKGRVDLEKNLNNDYVEFVQKYDKAIAQHMDIFWTALTESVQDKHNATRGYLAKDYLKIKDDRLKDNKREINFNIKYEIPEEAREMVTRIRQANEEQTNKEIEQKEYSVS
ncbi:MAG: hypothetical protein ACOC80_09815 [Petrotogales bacterium]